MNKLAPALLLFLSATLFLQAQHTIEVEVSNFPSDKGMALIALYNSEATFLDREFKGAKMLIVSGKAVYTFTNIPSGTYAISTFHDEDENGKLTTNFVGIPKEKYGASNNAPARFGPPKWKDARFEVRNGSTARQLIEL